MKSRQVSGVQEGDETAAKILDEPARNLASIVEAVLDKIGELPVYPTGGVFLAPTGRERFREALSSSWPGAVATDTVGPEPLDGVFLIAREGLS
jgi:N-acetylglucosamine kinase-like BadF-type ATPase